jgi:predicted DNA-binding protein (MmcQ/YjbR family)
MISVDTFRRHALSFPETDEQPHFEITSFRVKNKVFATLNVRENRATLRFSPEDQYAFSAVTNGAVFPVPNKWGKYGWTHLDLEKADEPLMQDALQTAWCEAAPAKFRKKYPDRYYTEDV